MLGDVPISVLRKDIILPMRVNWLKGTNTQHSGHMGQHI